jgi:hypothetical protein
VSAGTKFIDLCMEFPAPVVSPGFRLRYSAPIRVAPASAEDFCGEHAEIGDAGRDQDDYRGHQAEFGSNTPVAAKAASERLAMLSAVIVVKAHGRSHSARATVLTAGRLVSPALVHPIVSRLEGPPTVSVLTTSSKHFGPVALALP